MRIQFLLPVLFLFMASSLPAQFLRYGFKTGLNFAHLNGPSETDADGTALETFDNITGFHIGMTLAHKFSDNFGARAEILYSKKGMRYTFDGPSYRVFNYSGGSILATGHSKYLINVNNSYIDVPLTVYGRFGDFELSAGGYVGFLVQSVGDGSLTFTEGKSVPLGNNIDKVQFNLSQNYRKDEPGGGESDGDKQVVRVDNKNIELLKTVGAYYDYKEDKGSLYNSLDYGIVGGVSYYLSSALYLSARIQYGFSDVTNNNADASKSQYGDGGAQIFRNDTDKNFSIQASVGFSF